MTMFFTSLRFDDPLIYRACCFPRMPFLPRSLTAASLRFVVTNFVSLIPVQCTKSSLTPLLLLSPKSLTTFRGPRLSWQSHIPFGSLFNFQGTVRRSFTCSHWEEQNYRVFLKNFLFYKRSFHSFGQRGSKCTPIFEIFQDKFFIYRKYPLTYLELQSQMTPYFTEKMRKYFLVAGALFCLL